MDGKVDEAELLKSVQRKIWASLKARGSLRVASQRGVEMGDVAIINFVALRAETGEEITGSRQVKMHLDTVEESPFMGLESELSGAPLPSLSDTLSVGSGFLPALRCCNWARHIQRSCYEPIIRITR